MTSFPSKGLNKEVAPELCCIKTLNSQEAAATLPAFVPEDYAYNFFFTVTVPAMHIAPAWKESTFYCLFWALPSGLFFMCLLCSHQNKVTNLLTPIHLQSKLRITAMERVITSVQRIISRQVEGMREFSSSQDSCCLKTMNTRLMEACEPSQETLKAAVNFLTLLWALISPWGVSILFYKAKWAAGFFFTMGPDLLIPQLLRWRHLDTLQLLSSGRKQFSFCNKILPTVILKV